MRLGSLRDPRRLRPDRLPAPTAQLVDIRVPEQPAVVPAIPMNFDPSLITNRDHLAVRSNRNVGRWFEYVVYEFPTPDHPEILISRDGLSVGRDELVVARVETQRRGDVGFHQRLKPASLQ
jgi:hypothetical protein